MKFAVSSLVLLALTCCATPTVRDGLTASPVPVSQLSFLTGSWLAITGDVVSEESWMPPRGGTMLGTNRTVKSGKTSHYEFLRIVEEAAGTFYVANPANQESTRFVLVEATATSAVFENPHHDFPQRIRYAAEGDGLRATISGTISGTLRTSSWFWRRAR